MVSDVGTTKVDNNAKSDGQDSDIKFHLKPIGFRWRIAWIY